MTLLNPNIKIPVVEQEMGTPLLKPVIEKRILKGWWYGMNKSTLSFIDHKEENHFQRDYTNRSLILMRIALVFGATQYLLFALLDPIVDAGNILGLLSIRLLVIGWITCVLLLSFRREFKDWFQILVGTVPIIGGLGVAAMIILFQQTGGYHDFYVGIMLIFFYTHALLRLRFVWATLAGWLLFFIYLGATLLVGIDVVSLFNNCFYLVSAQICGMVASYALEYYARIVYQQSKDLEWRNKLIQTQHDHKAGELNSIRDIQLSLLPKEPPSCPGYKINAGMKTAAEIGGDFFDFSVSKDCKLTFAIGDATGHGAKAGALVTAAKILFISMGGRKDLASFLKKASIILGKTGLKKLYMSMAIGRLYENKLELAGAGMPPAYIWRAAKQSIEKIPLNGMPLGASAKYPYSVIRMEFLPGDLLFLMSDGLPELFNKNGEMMGYDEPERILEKYANLEPTDFIVSVEAEIQNFSEGEPLRDDILIIAIKKEHFL